MSMLYLLTWLFLVIWVIAALKDFVISKKMHGERKIAEYVQVPWSPVICNFMVRFLYMIYLEVAICACINYTNMSFVDNYTGFSSLLSIFAGIFCLLAILGAV